MAGFGSRWKHSEIARLVRRPRALVWLGLLTAVAVGLGFVPLVGGLGFEFAFVMALVGSLAAIDLGAFVVRDARQHGLLAASLLARVVALGRRAVGLAAVVLVPALVVATITSLRRSMCEAGFGLVCFGLLTFTSAALAGLVGVALGLVAGSRRVVANALPYLTVLAIIGHATYRFYSTPPVFFYNLLCGYYPGNLYDEEIALGAPFYWSRLYQLAAVIALLAGAALASCPERLAVTRRPSPARRRGLAIVFALAATVALGLRLDGGRLGFAVTRDDIARALGGRYDTAHFIIYYPKGGEIERDIAVIAEDHEFRLAQLERTLGVSPAGKITSFYFASAEQKFHWMGARNVYMAKPWRHEIYLNHMPFPHQVVRHELAHVLAGEFGDPIFHVAAQRVLGLPLAFNVGLIEGLAVAADWPDHFNRALTPHQAVKAMLVLGNAPPIDRLLSTGFLAFSSAQGYTTAGSFVRFLLERHGAEAVRALYRNGGDFDAAFGQPQSALVAEWRQMIDATVLPAGAAEVVRERFRRPSIFKRPCAHRIAALERDASVDAAGGDDDHAIALVRQICEEDPGEPSHRLALADQLAAADDDEADAIYRELAGDAEHISSTLRAEAELGLAGRAARRGDAAALTAALARARALPLEDDLARNVIGRQLAAAHAGAAGPILRAYFWPPGDGKSDGTDHLARAALAAVAEPELGFAHYLLGRNLADHGLPAETARELGRALDLGLPDPLIERECASELATAAYLAGDLAAVDRAATILARPDQPEVTRLLGEDFRERVAWKRTGALPATSR